MKPPMLAQLFEFCSVNLLIESANINWVSQLGFFNGSECCETPMGRKFMRILRLMNRISKNYDPDIS